MAYITLEQAKKQLLVDDCFTADDQYITELIEVAETVLSEDICHDLSDFVKDNKLVPALRQAILLLVGNYYSNREPVAFASSSEVPLSYKHLIGLYRDYLG